MELIPTAVGQHVLDAECPQLPPCRGCLSSWDSAGEFAGSNEGDGEVPRRLSGLQGENCRAAKSGEKANKTVLLIFKSSRQPEVLGCELCAASDSGGVVMFPHSSASKMGATRKICTNLSKVLVLRGKSSSECCCVLLLSLLMDKRWRFMTDEFV